VLLILRDAFYGVRTFSAFHERLGMAKTVLSDRLQRLTDRGILERVQPRPDVGRFEYRLSRAGRDLFPVLVALVQWGDRWVFGPGREPIQILDRPTRSPIQKVEVQARDGHVLDAREVTFAAGPGASEATRALLAKFDTTNAERKRRP
jgi:DNA-binding HxlR family transcriptional regulator